jgi:hypothetical protein
MEYLKNHLSANSSWFWRTHQQQKIDYIKERSGGLLAVEIKSQTGKGKIPATFMKAYSEPAPPARLIFRMEKQKQHR